MGPSFDFMRSKSDTADVVRKLDWSKHPLGVPERWPITLRIMLGVMFNSRHPMLIWWGAELHQFYNDAYVPSIGQRHPAAMGQRANECWAEAWPQIGSQVQRVVVDGEPVWREDQLVPILRNGRMEDVYWTYGYSAILDDAGRRCGVFVVCTETTQQVVTLQELQRSQKDLSAARQELDSFLMQAPIGIAILKGPSHIYSFMNPMFRTLCFSGRSAEEFLGKTVRVAVPELEGQGFYEILDGVYQTGQPFVGSKVRATLMQAGGSNKELFINFTYQAKRDAQGQIDGILAVVYEVTDQVNEQKEIEVLANNLRAAIIARDNFLAVASHELNTPLTSLKLQVQMSERFLAMHGAAGFPPEKVEKLVTNTSAQSQRLERLVNDMLDVSKLTAGKLNITLARSNLSALVQSVLERYGPQLLGAGCKLEVRILPDMIVDMDAARIEQVLGNFLVNAAKYAPNTVVHATVERLGPHVEVSIRDEGRGIAEEHLARIFGRFERATERSEASGLGLGLYIAKQIIQEHHGHISVESPQGQGAKFSFQLPVH